MWPVAASQWNEVLFDDGEDLPLFSSFLVWQQHEGTGQNCTIIQLPRMMYTCNL
jgi:hypothetical protein